MGGAVGGGGLLLQAENVTITSSSVLSASGGAGAPYGDFGTFNGPFAYGSGAGGGGRIVVVYSGSGITNGAITASGGPGWTASANGADGSVILAQNSLVPVIPGIAASFDSGDFLLSWSASATNYVLQTSPSLALALCGRRSPVPSTSAMTSFCLIRPWVPRAFSCFSATRAFP